jgi:hypothetical protein
LTDTVHVITAVFHFAHRTLLQHKYAQEAAAIVAAADDFASFGSHDNKGSDVVNDVVAESVHDLLMQPMQLWSLLYFTAEFLRLFTKRQKQQQQQQQQQQRMNTVGASLPISYTITGLQQWARHHALDDAQLTVVKVVGQLLLEELHANSVAIDAAKSRATTAVLKRWRTSVRHWSQYASDQLQKVR